MSTPGKPPAASASVAVDRRRTTRYRRDTLWRAAMIHRLSGLALACFLPLHFLALGLAIEGESRLQGFLTWTEQPLVRLAEVGLVALLAVHLLGGLRVMMVESMAWRPGQPRLALAVLAAAAMIAALFFFLRIA